MQLIADLHTHTLLSGHAFSTIRENAQAGAKAGLSMLANTDHGPAMRGATQAIYYFVNQNILPREIEGVRILRGAEVNILGDAGQIDLPPEVLGHLELVIASLHDVTIDQGDITLNTDRLIAVIESGLIDIIGHPGNPYFPVDAERLVRSCKDNGVAIEVNNSSLAGTVRPGSKKNMIEILNLCREEKALISVGSDAHWMDQVGNLDAAKLLLAECNIPASLVVSSGETCLQNFLEMRNECRRSAIQLMG
ncbi:phosphatase [Clostridia bacterium]|nr:phosphatase [Clostridia bacterium]